MATSSYQKVDVGHVSRAEEHQFLADLTGFPSLAAMLAFELTLKNRKTRKKKPPTINSQVAVQIKPENEEQGDQKPSESTVTEVPNFEESQIVTEVSDDEVMGNDQNSKIQGEVIEQPSEMEKKREEERNSEVVDEVNNGHIIREDDIKKNKKRKGEINIPSQSNKEQLDQIPKLEGENRGNEVMGNNQILKFQREDAIQLTELKKCQEEERNDNVIVNEVKNGHVPKVDEYKMLADLTSFPNLAAMMAFQASCKNNREKNKRKRDTDIESQNDKVLAAKEEIQAAEITDICSSSAQGEAILDPKGTKTIREIVLKETAGKSEENSIETRKDTDQHNQKPEFPVIEVPKLEDNVILTEDGDNDVLGHNQLLKIHIENAEKPTDVKKKREEDKNDNFIDGSGANEVNKGHISKADEYKMLADLTDYPNLAAMFAFEASLRKKKKNRNKKKRSINIQSQNDKTLEEDTQTNTCKTTKTTEACQHDGSLSSFEISSICSSLSQREVILDLDSSKATREAVLKETVGKGQENNIEALEDTIDIMEEDMSANSSNERMHSQPEQVKMINDILPRKLLHHPRCLNQKGSGRGKAADNHRSVKVAVQKREKSSFSRGSFHQNANHCKQVLQYFNL
ncbi:hypothetical protein NMG60_11001605 [Bertholletia excelsa]